jgi:hypothetical protein
MNRDSKGRFCSSDENELVQHIGIKKYSDIHKKLMEEIDPEFDSADPDGDWYFKTIKNPVSEEGSGYTVGVKVVAFYDVEVRANSPEEAIEKISEMSSYKLLTEEIPVDSRDPVFSWLALQDV